MNLAEISREFRELPIGLIDEPPLPSRSAMDETRLEELVASIRAVGLVQPMSVVRIGDRYEVVAGHRRRIACGRAGRLTAPCIIYPTKDAALAAIQFAENRHREELSPADEAIWFSELLEQKCGDDVDALCSLIGEKRAYVEGRLLLLRGDPEVFKALERGDIGIGIAQQLNRCDDEPHRRMLLYQAIRGGATVAVVSGWIAEYEQIHKAAIGGAASSDTAAPSGPVAQLDYFRCALCEKADNVHLMQPVNIHTYCHAAMFADMLERYQRRHEYFRWPRTTDEAAAMVNDLAERFPELAQ